MLKSVIYGCMFLVVTLSLNACQECSIVEDSGNPARQFRLVDAQGNDLWFGANAQYNPAEFQIIHETEGVLPTTVNNALKSVAVIIPMTGNDEEVLTVKLDSNTTENLTYATLEFNEDCKKVYELSYLFENGEKICGACGNTRFNDDQFIYLKK